MQEEIIHKFESIFTELINTEQGDVKFAHSPNPCLQKLAEGLFIQYAFHYIISYKKNNKYYFLCFVYLQSNELISIDTYKYWAWGVKYLENNISVCLLSDIGFTEDVLNSSSDSRLILAKFCGDTESTLVLNRLWTNYADRRGRLGVFTSTTPCKGAVLYKNSESYNPVGILSELGISIRPKYELKCPYLSDQAIEERALEVLNDIGITGKDFLETQKDYLYTIANRANIKIELVEMGSEFFGEYSYADKTIYLNAFEENKERRRFTIAHELGHHYLHRNILEQYDYKTIEENETINIVGADNVHSQYIEIQANKFASYLLMPGELFVFYAREQMKHMGIKKGRVRDDDQYSPSEGYFNHVIAMEFMGKVADFFKVSKEAAKYRLIALGLLEIDKHDFPTPKNYI